METQSYIILIAVGILSGLLGGLLGLGGAIIIIPALVMLLGYSQQMAQGTMLLIMSLPVGALAAFQYYQKGFVDIKAAVILAVCFFASGYVGARFATHIPPLLLKRMFAVMLIVIAVKLLFVDKN